MNHILAFFIMSTHIMVLFVNDYSMPPELMFTMAQIWNKSRSEFLISYHNEAAKQYGYDIDLITTCQTSMYMSGRTHTCHLYRRKQRGKIPSSEKENDIEFGFPCDPIFKEAFDLCLKAVSERRTYVSNEIIACYKREPRARKPNYYLEIDRIARESSARQGAVLSKKRRAHCVVVSKRKRGKKIIY